MLKYSYSINKKYLHKQWIDFYHKTNDTAFTVGDNIIYCQAWDMIIICNEKLLYLVKCI